MSKGLNIFIINFIYIAENNMPNNMNNDPVNWYNVILSEKTK